LARSSSSVSFPLGEKPGKDEMKRSGLLSMIVLLATTTGVLAQTAKNAEAAVTNVPPVWRQDAKEVFSKGGMCFIWTGTNVVVQKKAGAISIGPFFALSDRSLSFKVSTEIPGFWLADGRVLTASPDKATQFELSFDSKQLAGKTNVSVQLVGYGMPADLWAGKQIGNLINLMVDADKLEAHVLKDDPKRPNP
jgi:hypothetical protein